MWSLMETLGKVPGLGPGGSSIGRVGCVVQLSSLERTGGGEIGNVEGDWPRSLQQEGSSEGMAGKSQWPTEP